MQATRFGAGAGWRDGHSAQQLLENDFHLEQGELGPQAVTPAAPEWYPVADLAWKRLKKAFRSEVV